MADFKRFFDQLPSSKIGIDSLLNMTPLDSRTQKHLSKVYSVLAAGILVTAGGAWFHRHIFAIPGILSLIGCIGCMLGVNMMGSSFDSKRVVAPKRLAMAGGLFFLKGAAMGDLLSTAFRYQGVVPTAFFGTLALFTAFSAAAIFAKRREYLYLGGMLGTAVGFMSMISLANMFFRSAFVMDAMLYVGLAVFSGYLVVDTQVIIEQSSAGNQDFLQHAIMLYVDLVAVFIRLVLILMKNANKNKEGEKRRR